MKLPLVFNIQRFSTHDGPGIRTVVFLKGCPLVCAWCENPESQDATAEILFDRHRCVSCRACLALRFRQAMREEEGWVVPDRSKPVPHGLAGVCPSLAIRVAGETMTPEGIVAAVMADEAFYRQSGGGVTFSGGEPLLYPEFLAACLDLLRDQGVPVAVETCLAVDPENLAPFLDRDIHWLPDVKHADAAVFRRGTGGDLAQVQANIRRLVAAAPEVTFRLPIIPGFNEDGFSMEAIFNFIGGLERASPQAPRLDLLPFHQLAAGKYGLLGRNDPYAADPKLHQKTLARWREAAATRNFQVTVGG